jgi:hypothetical protein
MMRPTLPASAIAVALALALGSSLASAQSAPAPGSQPAAARPPAVERRLPAAPVRMVTESQDANQTRGELERLLSRYPPALRGVLKLDPGLLTSAEYLAPYPGLAEFLASHPEIARDPAYYFEDVDLPWVESRRQAVDPQMAMINMWRNAMEASIFFVAFLVITSTLVWLIKTLIDYRRWSRLSKSQGEVHNKLLDRFANNEELLAYVQTPAGRRFLESAPIMLDAAASPVAAPLRRILFAVEAGFVILAGGTGVEIASRFVPAEVAPVLFVIGIIGMSLGAGFIIAAAASFFISKRLGLFQPSAPATAGGQPGA